MAELGCIGVEAEADAGNGMWEEVGDRVRMRIAEGEPGDIADGASGEIADGVYMELVYIPDTQHCRNFGGDAGLTHHLGDVLRGYVLASC